MLSRSSGLAGAAALAATLLAPALASAAEDRVISGAETIGGKLVVNKLTIASGGKLTVPKWNGTTGGTLDIEANTIVIEKGGLIDASGAGYAGKVNADGDAPVGTGGGGKFNTNMTLKGLPGGGGGFFGPGAGGTQEAVPDVCTATAGSEGGSSFFTMVPNLGAAGGSSSNGALSSPGSAGGGSILLSAAVVQILGTITANGLGSVSPGGAASGAGSGGTIQIFAAAVTGDGQLEVRGGDGAHGNGNPNPGSSFPANNGGGGSGGVIIVKLTKGGMLPSNMKTVLTGGATGMCLNAGGANGMVVYIDPMKTCLDLDGDMHDSEQCGGDDCDDTDGAINPGGVEKCDGKDNDCNGKVDDGDDLCSPGSSCVMGKCVADAKPDAGAGGGGGGGEGGKGGGNGARPDHIEFGGGCAVPGRPGLAEGAAGAAMLSLGVVALAASRRARRRTAPKT